MANTIVCLQVVVPRIIDALTISSSQNEEHNPTSNFPNPRGSSKPETQRDLLELLIPFHDDPKVQMHFWQLAMPLLPEWFEEFYQDWIKFEVPREGQQLFLDVKGFEPFIDIFGKLSDASSCYAA